MIRKTLPLLCALACAPAFAEVVLTGDKAPTEQPWAEPATLSHVRSGDGSDVTTVHANLAIKGKRPLPGEAPGLLQYGAGVYWHKDTGDDTRQNDRGVSLSAYHFRVVDTGPSGAVVSYQYSGVLQFGKSLTQLADDGGPTRYDDKTKDREVLAAELFYQPAGDAGWTHHTQLKGGAYSDHASGGGASPSGRVSGLLARADWTLYPAGTDGVGATGIAPVLHLLAQHQHDRWTSGGRDKGNHKLYAASLGLEFNNAGKFVPTFSLARSIGADLLAGRAYIGRTELALGLKVKL